MSDHTARLPKNLNQMTIAAAITGGLGCLIEYVMKGPSVSFYVILVFTIITMINVAVFKKDKISTGMIVTIYSSVMLACYVSWIGGGFHDLSITIFPMAMIMMALFGNIFHTVILYLFLISAILFLGITTVNGTNPYPPEITDYTKTLSYMLIFSFAAYLSFLFSSDFRGSLRDLAEESFKSHLAREKLKKLAHHDHLTGLSNRVSLAQKYEEIIANINFDEESVCFYFMDLDNFKYINDTFNHSVGDELLIEAGKRVKSIVNDNDMVSRLGGDEFLIMIVRPSGFSFETVAKDLLDEVVRPFSISGHEIDVTTSVGIAIAPGDGVNFDDIRKKSDIAMYKAKSLGKNIFQFYDVSLQKKINEKLNIVKSIKRGIRNNSFELYFQPKVDIETGKIKSAEALIRWVKDNPYGLSPAEFIPVIENTGLIVEVGEWVLKEACFICKKWHQQGYAIPVAVNISPMQLSRNNLPYIIQHALEAAALSPNFLEIELTEYMLLNHTNEVLSQLSDIKKMGVSLAIDDFGTGYSNLSYLTRFKVDTLKLDRSFVFDLSESAESLAIARAIIVMAKIIGLRTVAEGVETDEVWEVLKELGCDFGQGYLWGKPVPNEAFLEQLKAA